MTVNEKPLTRQRKNIRWSDEGGRDLVEFIGQVRLSILFVGSEFDEQYAFDELKPCEARCFEFISRPICHLCLMALEGDWINLQPPFPLEAKAIPPWSQMRHDRRRAARKLQLDTTSVTGLSHEDTLRFDRRVFFRAFVRDGSVGCSASMYLLTLLDIHRFECVWHWASLTGLRCLGSTSAYKHLTHSFAVLCVASYGKPTDQELQCPSLGQHCCRRWPPAEHDAKIDLYES